MLRLRTTVSRWQAVAAVAVNVGLCELGARIGLPGVDGAPVAQVVRSAHRSLLALYNVLAEGGTERAAILALGAIPYAQARVVLWLAGRVSPALRRAVAVAKGRRYAVYGTTAGLALLQSVGFARFLQSIAGAVAEPGVAFVARTVLLLTGGALAVGWLGETILGAMADAARPRAVAASRERSPTPTPPPVRAPAASAGAELDAPRRPSSSIGRAGGGLPRVSARQDPERAF